VTVLIRTASGNRKAVNLSNRSWETAPLEGDDSKIKMTMDDGEEFIMKVSSFDALMEKLEQSEDFMSLD